MTIAFDRYNNALEGIKPEERIMYATMALEALYLNEKQELKRRFSQRTASALGFMDHDPLKVSKTTKKAYDLRSKFVHGVIIKQNDKETSRF